MREINQFEQIKRRKFRDFQLELRRQYPDDMEDPPMDVVFDAMLASAIKSGWVSEFVVKTDDEDEDKWERFEATEELLDDFDPAEVIENGIKVLEHYTELRTPDPN